MLPLPRAPRVAAALLTAAVAGLTAFQTTTADAAPTRPVLTAEARAAGVTPGNATMGWRQQSPTAGRSAASTLPSTTAPSATTRVGAGSALASARTAAVKKKAFVPKGVLGIDVSSWQRDVNWDAQVKSGKVFAYVKATEGTGYKNPYFRSQYTGSYYAGMVRGAYHFATPNTSSGKKQAQVFAKNGGGWSPDGRTLPGVLDIEYNPYGSTCYGLSKASMVAWVKSFTAEYKRLTTRDAVIYTTTDWWTRCTGNSKALSATNPLWLARYATTPGTLPGGWTWATFWQYTNTPLDQNRFSSTYARLVVLATDAG
ncbi:Lyzozyme M1 (1,4-beta-N-acetylmuramidase), GH25 family [Friedmanniella luteola]|uniref:lysozyme n=1 Tax=Friedmanniella luteola TaxID=546871 RepID=A0A1H1L623_9ACTN|nr:lysozyme [Friedmanniella luteola]SDR69936.1 Lyzozyme M1 (1,4-beta-N-acetylmuramidase), GH25 family [Friedmanniella luteola]